jgi:STAS-like domain of unknown function (DUF4325)
MKSIILSVARDFSPSPAGRYIEDGPFPGAVFRDTILIPAVQNNDVVTVDLDGTDGYGSSFLEEAFGGLNEKLKIESSRKSYAIRAWGYIKKANEQNKS